MKASLEAIEALEKIPFSLMIARDMWWTELISAIKSHNYTSEDKYKIKLVVEDTEEIKDALSAFQFAVSLNFIENKEFVETGFMQTAGDIISSRIIKYNEKIFWERYMFYNESPDSQALIMRISNTLARVLTGKEVALPEAVFIAHFIVPFINICHDVVLSALGITKGKGNNPKP